MRVKWARVVRQFVHCLFGVVYSVNKRPLKTESSLGRVIPFLAGLSKSLQGVATIKGHEFVSRLVVRGVQGNSKRERESQKCQTFNGRRHTNRGNRQVSSGESAVLVQASNDFNRHGKIRQRFAHAHEHNV